MDLSNRQELCDLSNRKELCDLPPDVLECILKFCCIETKAVLLDSGLLQSMASRNTYDHIEEEVYAAALQAHRKKLARVLACLPFHTYYGAPMHGRACHTFRKDGIARLRERIVRI